MRLQAALAVGLLVATCGPTAAAAEQAATCSLAKPDRAELISSYGLPLQHEGEPDLVQVDELYLQSLERLVALARCSEQSGEQPSSRRLQDLDDAIAGMQAQAEGYLSALDHAWVLICGFMVMFMQAGFALLEAGAVRARNASTVLLKNLADVCIGTLVWYFVGFGLAYGAEGANLSTFAGGSNFATSNFFDDNWAPLPIFKDWFFQWAFCATAATIVSGAVAERVHFGAYCAFSLVMSALIYPIIVWWTWSGNGWATAMGYSDFAGSGVVHLCGGTASLVAAAILGPRNGRWMPGSENDFMPHSVPLVVLGTLTLWFGWYGFNPGSTLVFNSMEVATQAALVAMNTTIAASMGGLTVFFIRTRTIGKYDVVGLCNGILAGLVAICAACGDTTPAGALLVGFLGAIFYEAGHYLEERLKIDDPLEAFPVHGMGGICGLLLRGLVDVGGVNGDIFMGCLLGMLGIIAWTATLTALTLLPLRALNLLRVSDEHQALGTDCVEMEPKASYTISKQSGNVIKSVVRTLSGKKNEVEELPQPSKTEEAPPAPDALPKGPQ